MTLNGVMAVTLRYFSEVGKPALQKTICGGINARVYCCLFSACTMSSQRKFTFAISSPDEFLVIKLATSSQSMRGHCWSGKVAKVKGQRSKVTVRSSALCGGGIHFNGVSSRIGVLLVRAVSACSHPNQQLIIMLTRSTEHIQCIKTFNTFVL